MRVSTVPPIKAAVDLQTQIINVTVELHYGEFRRWTQTRYLKSDIVASPALTILTFERKHWSGTSHGSMLLLCSFLHYVTLTNLN